MNETTKNTAPAGCDGGGLGHRALAKGMAGQNMQALPEDFVPGEHDVICGRGRKAFNHVGNASFRKLVESRLEEYSTAVAKLEKSYILSDIVCEVRQRSPDGGFVKRDTSSGRWFEVGDFLAREKTSQAFRDALHDQYKSSNTAKKKRRQAEQTNKLLMGQHSSTRSLFCERSLGLEQQSSSRSLQIEHQDSSRSLQTDPGYGAMSHQAMPIRFETHGSLLGSMESEFSNDGSLRAPKTLRMNTMHGQRSMRSVVDFAPTRSNSDLGKGNMMNNSCPNFGWDVDPEPLPHSPPQQLHMSSSGLPSMYMVEPLPSYSKSGMDADMMDVDPAPFAQSSAQQDDSDSFGDDLILSPIGDGSPRRLFNSLTRLNEGVEPTDMFQPAPLLDL